MKWVILYTINLSLHQVYHQFSLNFFLNNIVPSQDHSLQRTSRIPFPTLKRDSVKAFLTVEILYTVLQNGGGGIDSSATYANANSSVSSDMRCGKNLD